MSSWLSLVTSELIAGVTLRKAPSSATTNSPGFLRRQLEGFTVAIAMALLLKQFTFDTFQVPTESMEPVIIGRGDMGDRILVDRFAYMVNDPERYDIVVFKYPLSRLVNYVKRAVGLSGERIKLWHGQVYADPTGGTNFAVTRKPDSVQDAIFDANPVIPSEEVDGLTRAQLIARWQVETENSRADPDPEFDAARKAVVLKATANGDRLIKTRSGITNARTDPNAADAKGRQGGDEAVADVRVRFDAQPDTGAGAIVVEVHDPAQPGQSIRVECGVDGGQASRALHGSKDLTTAEFAAVRIKPGTSTPIEVDHVDHRIVVRIDGREVFRYDYVVAPVDVAGGNRGAAIVKLGVHTGSGAVSRIAIFRDVHYTRFDGHTDEFEVPKGSYLMLGDNSPNSLDARGWRRSRIRMRTSPTDPGRILDGDFEAVSDRIENVRRGHNPFMNDDNKPAFIDVQGNLHHLRPKLFDILDPITNEVRAPEVDDINAVDPTVYAVYDHYTPRAYVVGRAAIVFFVRPRILR